jgi:hypothetical protein
MSKQKELEALAKAMEKDLSPEQSLEKMISLMSHGQMSKEDLLKLFRMYMDDVPGEVSESYMELWTDKIIAAGQAHTDKQNKVKAGAAGKGSIKSPMKERILAGMKSYKASDYTFKEFISEWLEAPINDLSISINEDKYLVRDVFSDIEEKNYSLETLKQYFSKNMN